jgi:hypothetical protein
MRFENRIGRTVCRPHLSAPRRPPHHAAPCRTLLLMTGPPSCSGPPVSHVDPHRADPAALHSRAATHWHRAPWPGHCRADAMPPCCSTRRHPSCPLPSGPLPAAPLKTEPPVSRSASTRSSQPSTPEGHTHFPYRPGVHLAGLPPPEPLLRAGTSKVVAPACVD